MYFCSAYTGRDYHENATARRLSAAVFLAVVSAKVTNPIHERYFTTTEVTVPFEHLAIEHGLFHWGATGLSYELYAESGYDTRPLALLTGLLAFPIVLGLVALLTPRLVSVIYAPLGVAAFAVALSSSSSDGFRRYRAVPISTTRRYIRTNRGESRTTHRVPRRCCPGWMARPESDSGTRSPG